MHSFGHNVPRLYGVLEELEWEDMKSSCLSCILLVLITCRSFHISFLHDLSGVAWRCEP